MMQRNGCPSNFVHKFLAARLDLFQIRRPERRVSRAREYKIRHLKVAYWTIVGRGGAIDFLRDAQRSFTYSIVRPDVAD